MTQHATGVIAVVGATATGKSDLALDLAEALGGEIVNADAMQLYRGMDIGTAKTPPEQRRGIPHHQLDVLDVTEEASVAVYQRRARADVARIRERGRVAVVVGGSGLYVRALLDDLAFPETDPALRAELEQRLAEEGPGLLHDELARLDPEAAARIDRRNGRRVVRALEVVRLTGRPFAASQPTRATPVVPAVQVAIDVPREELAVRVADRARRMFDDGLLEETAALVEAGLDRGRTASRAVGYVQARAVLAGESTLDEALEATVVATRQLARRQLTWFRRDDRIHWLAPGPDLAARASRLVA
ncbi:tRNA (adenosine(37)-N6)-dimethylallyltransferase MiaA [Actinotalea caeni]|uniref:tRNA (adenosine(37)-N6)-dimethylallyltransferase MiaA n=1 Tax=Actinotalea caeni TaxID=1348467 RepID=UPI001F037E05|nr:tRNA (adenosine(37)-N6)-dimethylallyltransferase MiaA [Actinotalea caeni]